MVHDRLFSSFLRKTVTRLGLSLALSRLLRRRLWRIRLRRGLLGLRFSSLLVLAAGGISAVLFRGVGPLVTASEERRRDDDPNEAQERHYQQSAALAGGLGFALIVIIASIARGG
jgi:hypothetical protein